MERRGTVQYCSGVYDDCCQEFVPRGIKQYRKQVPSQQKEEDASLRGVSNSNIQRVVGWSIRSMDDRRSKELTRGINRNKAEFQLKMLRKMSLSQDEVTPEYESKYYSLEDRIFNKGGLTLVHAALFPWGIAMLSGIRKNLNHKTISKLKGGALQLAWYSLKMDEELVNEFKTGFKSLDANISDTQLEELHEDLLKKVFHAEANFEVSEFMKKKLKSANDADGSQVQFRSRLKRESEQKRQRDMPDEAKTKRKSKRQKTKSN